MLVTQEPTPSSAVVALEGVTKEFGPVKALTDVSLSLASGEVVGLLGENGAGKSTMLRILSGDYRPDGGRVLVDGRPVAFESPRDAHTAGIYVVYQEPEVALDLSVAENLALGRLPSRNGVVSPRRVVAHAAEQIEALGFGGTVDPRQTLRFCSPAQRQCVEILKAVQGNVRLLCLDEPTSSLSDQEANRLWDLMARLSASGTAIVYVSHRMAEIDKLCDRLVVMRDGRKVAEHPVGSLRESQIVSLMVGRPLERVFPSRDGATGEVVLAARNVTAAGVHDLDLEVRAGEIVGVAGLVGSGRTELAEALSGASPLRSGTVSVNGSPVALRSPADAMAAGICRLTEDRRGQGLFLDRSVSENVVLPSLRRFARFGVVDRSRVAAEVRHRVGQMRVKTHDVREPVSHLSGGNQQKALLARWVAMSPRVLLLDEPTRGIDVGAKADIYRLLNELTRDGMAVVMISSELNELLGLADRIVVMRDGTVVGHVDPHGATEQDVLEIALGVKGSAA